MITDQNHLTVLGIIVACFDSRKSSFLSYVGHQIWLRHGKRATQLPNLFLFACQSVFRCSFSSAFTICLQNENCLCGRGFCKGLKFRHLVSPWFEGFATGNLVKPPTGFRNSWGIIELACICLLLMPSSLQPFCWQCPQAITPPAVFPPVDCVVRWCPTAETQPKLILHLFHGLLAIRWRAQESPLIVWE